MHLSSGRSTRPWAVTALSVLAVSASVLAASPAHAVERVLTETDVDLNYTRTAGSNTFLADGVQVTTVGTTSQSKAAGYFDVDHALADVGEPSMSYLPESGSRPGLQLVVDLDGDGAEDGTLVGEPTVYGANWWLPGSTIDGVPVDQGFRDDAPKVGGGGSSENGTLDEWREAFPDAAVTRYGWSLGSGVEGDGVIKSMTIAGDLYNFTAGEVTTTTLHRSDVVQRDTRAQGSNTFRPNGGVRILTNDSSGQAKATGYFAVGQPLATVGEPTWEYALAEGIEPGKQLVIDLDGDLTTTGDRGILVGEDVYGKNWWATNGSSQDVKDSAPQTGGGNGSNWFGTLNQWRQKAPNAVVLEGGWSLGSGVKGDGILSSFRIGQTVYEFAGNRAPVAEDLTASTPRRNEIDLTPEVSDPDTQVYDPGAGPTGIADTLTVAVGDVSGGSAELLENGEIRFEPADDFLGDAEVEYTVTDDRGASDTATATVSVTNSAPVAGNATGKTLARSAATVSRTLDVAVSTSDADGDDLTLTVEKTSGGTASIVGGDTVRFRPAVGFSGRATVTYSVTDGDASDTGTVTVTVSKSAATIRTSSRTLASRNTYVTGSVSSAAGTNPSASTGQAVIITRGGKEIGRGRVIDGKLVDRVKRTTRPGILIGKKFRKGASFGVTLVYPGTSTVAARTQRVQVNIPR